MQRHPPARYLSLFTGSMGLDLGLERAGFRVLAANEIDKPCVETIRRNRPDVPLATNSIEELTAEDHVAALAGQPLTDLPLVAGGPPCQAFAIFGRRRGLQDDRGKLIFEYLRIVAEARPKVFVMENVRGLHSIPERQGDAHGSLLRTIFREFEAIGYRVDCFVVNAVNYGAPQIRERVICIGKPVQRRLRPLSWHRFTATGPRTTFRRSCTLGDAIGEWPSKTPTPIA